MNEMDVLKRYGRHVFYSEPDEEFIALCPDFPGVSAFGVSTEEALGVDIPTQTGH